MSRAPLVRGVLALAVLATSAYFVLTKPARLGLDLRGGSQLVLETRDSETAKANADSTHRTLEVMRRRADALRAAEPSIFLSRDWRIAGEPNDVHDSRQHADELARPA